MEARAPENVHELRSTLGMINYYQRFLPNHSAILHPLHQLFQDNQHWVRTKQCQKAFQNAKTCPVSAPVLAHYDSDFPLVLAADASTYGLGAVLSHTYSNGSDHPVAFASRTPSSSEQNYSQVEKETLALMFRICKFHQYVSRRRFTLVTDYQPLLSILGPEWGVTPLAAACMQRWALILSAYTYDISYYSTKDHANADGLSCLPLHGGAEDCAVVQKHTAVRHIEALPLRVGELDRATQHDPMLAKLHRYTEITALHKETR